MADRPAAPNTEPARDACVEALADLVEWFDAKSDQTGAEALMSLHLRIGRARDALAARGETT